MDRRRHPRTAVRFLAQHQAGVDGQVEVDYVSDVSHSGLFIETTRTTALASTLHVQFAPMKDASLVSAFCRVARVTSRGIGVEFLSLDSTAQALIASCQAPSMPVGASRLMAPVALVASAS
jgi:hypothetical protein